MAIHLEQSSSGYGAFHIHPVELPEFEFPSVAPEPVQPPELAPAPEPETPPETASGPWVQNLPAADFGPPAPDHGTPPGPNALNDLPQPPVLATTDVAPATSAAPAAGPTATPAEIAALELFLADPLNRELVHVHGGALPVLDKGEVTQGQVARYGADLTARLSQLAQANTAVRNLYLEAMDQAARNLGPGTPGAVFVPGGWGGGESDFVADSWRFDPVAFTQAYAQAGAQEGAPLAQRAFAALYGPDALQAWERRQGGGRGEDNTLRGFTLAGNFELTAPTLTDSEGSSVHGRLNWAGASLNPDSHELRPLSLHAPPDLHDRQAVWFDATLGWVTHGDNVVVRQDFMDKAIPVVAAIAAAWAVGPYAAKLGASAAAGGSFAAGAVKAGVMAAAGSAAMQIAGTGTLDFGQLVKTTLSGAITGGLVQGLGIAQNLGHASFSTRVMAMTAQATVQGAVQEVMGGRFRDGFTSGMASGLAAEITQALSHSLSQAGLSPAQHSAATVLTRATGSAIRALAGGDDAQRDFALDFLGGLVGSGLDEAQAWAGTRDQSAAESARLTRQNDVLAAPASNPLHTAHEQALARVNARWRVGEERDPQAPAAGPDPGTGVPGTSLPPVEIVGQRRTQYAKDLAEEVGGELESLLSRSLQTAAGVLDALEITPLTNTKAQIQAYLDARAEAGLSEAEMVVLGVAYAAIEVAFPTSMLDFAGGGLGKGVAAVGAVVIKQSGSVDELAAAARLEVRSTRLLDDWLQREVKYVKTDGSWLRKPADAQDAAPQLAASLERARRPGPAGYQPHHVAGFGDAQEETQRLLTKLGISPNEATNGIWLSPEMHQATYGPAYKRWVDAQFEHVSTAEAARATLVSIRTTLAEIEGKLLANPGSQVQVPWKP